MAGGLRCRIDIDGAALARRADAAAHAALAAAARSIQERSNAIAPRRTGAMIGSSSAGVEGRTARVSYVAAYAGIQHDATGFRHPRGGQAKYLATALMAPETVQAMKEGFITEST